MEKKEDQEIDRSKVRAEIVSWKPKKGEIMTNAEGQIFYVYFEKAFGIDKLAIYDEFLVKKPCFDTHLATCAKYINYFIHKYDEENELITAYLKLKFALDRDKSYNESNWMALVDLIYELIFTPSMCAKIRQMVDDNYLDDIEKGDSPYNGPNSKEYTKSLEFTNEHQKILLRISVGMRIIAPVAYHFFTINKIKPNDLVDNINVPATYYFNIPLFGLFQDDVNMYNKLYVYVERKVLDTWFHNSRIVEQRDILGNDLALLIEKFIKKQLIAENMVKYMFNDQWDPVNKRYRENIIGLNKVIIKFQLRYFLKEIYGKSLTEVTNTKNADGLSGSDKMEMNMKKMDVGIIDLAAINIETSVKQLLHDIDVPITEDEIAYYRQHHYPSDIQVFLVRSIYAGLFSSYREENLLTRRQYNILLILLKKKLLLDNGYESNDFGDAIYLPYILTGNLEGKANHKPIRDARLLAEIEADPIYQELVQNQYRELEEFKPGYVKDILATYINTEFTYVVYEDPSLLGKPIEAPARQLCYELLHFLRSIR